MMAIKYSHHLLFENFGTEGEKKSRKCSPPPPPPTSVTQPASCGRYHRDALRNSCTNKLLALFAVVSLITRNKGNRQKLLLFTTKHTHTLGFTFSQRAPAAETQCVRVNTCTCVCASFGPDTVSQMF